VYCFQLQEGKINWSVEKVVLPVGWVGIVAAVDPGRRGDEPRSDMAGCTWECVVGEELEHRSSKSL